jgi:hypothetical protein
VINTEDLAYVDLPCNDTLATPLLPTRNASNLTIEFDSSFLVETTSRASIVLVRDGKADQVWSRSYEDLNQHQRVGPLPVWGASKIRVFFRYDGQNEYFWMVDNIVITGT